MAFSRVEVELGSSQEQQPDPARAELLAGIALKRQAWPEKHVGTGYSLHRGRRGLGRDACKLAEASLKRQAEASAFGALLAFALARESLREARLKAAGSAG